MWSYILSPPISIDGVPAKSSQPKWSALDAVGTPAIMSFRMIWKATDEKIIYDDPQKQFRVEGYRATTQLEAQVKVPSIDFSWKSDPYRRRRSILRSSGMK